MPSFDEEMNDLFADEEAPEAEVPAKPEVADPVQEPAKTEGAEKTDPSIKNEVQLAKDFVELHKLYPEVTSMDDIEDKERFMRLRNNGCTIEEAYLATGGAKRSTARAGSGKAHLQSAVPKSAAGGEYVTRGEIEAARELLGDPKLTDKDIAGLIRRAKS